MSAGMWMLVCVVLPAALARRVLPSAPACAFTLPELLNADCFQLPLLPAVQFQMARCAGPAIAA